jgi:cobalt/nickel transport system permease protein
VSGRVSGTLGTLSGALRSFFVAERVSAREGFLQARDPRATLLAVFALALAAVVTRRPAVLLALAAAALALAYASAVPFRTLGTRVAVVALPSAFVVSPRLFLAPGEALFGAGLSVSAAGAAYVATFTLRVAVGAGLLSLLVLTTPFSGVLAALRWARVPVAVVWVSAVTYRYLFLLFDELRRLVLARGARTTESGFRAGWRDARGLAGTFLLRTVERGERVGRGMRARGGARAPNPYGRAGSPSAPDYALCAVALAALAVSGVLRWA